MAHVLLVEDDDSMRAFLSRALVKAGHRVTLASDGDSALGLIGQEPPDLLLTDIVMPGMDGIELAQRARACRPGLRVMFITGFAAVALQRGDTPEDAEIIAKPFHLRDLVDKIGEMFGGGGVPPSAD